LIWIHIHLIRRSGTHSNGKLNTRKKKKEEEEERREKIGSNVKEERRGRKRRRWGRGKRTTEG